MNKCLLLTLVTLSFTLFSNAQISKGSKLVGLDLSTSYYKTGNGQNETKQTAFYATPSIGVAVNDNSITGIRVLYGRQKTKYTTNPQEELNSYGGGVFLRRYFQLGKRTYLFGEAGADYRYGKSEQIATNFSTHTKENSVGLSLYPGFSYAVSKRLLLEAGLNDLLAINYSHSKSETTSSGTVITTKNTSFFASSVLGSNNTFTLGFRFLCTK